MRPAKTNETNILTRISFESKRYWGYPAEYFKVWKNELTISRDYIGKNAVYVYEIDAAIVGYYSIVDLPEGIDLPGTKLPKGFWLEHMFIKPRHIGKGIGSIMFRHMQDRCSKIGICEVGILSDPHSRGFYEKMGCRYMRDVPSTINNRTTPYLVLRI